MSRRSDPFWPCKLVKLDGGRHSIIFTAFDLVEHHLKGREPTGYAIEALVKRKLRASDPAALRAVRFDPESSMFSAYGKDRGALEATARVLRALSDVSEESARVETTARDRATVEDLLLRGFVTGLDVRAQKAFYALMPKPPISSAQRERLAALRKGKRNDRIAAARRINSEARQHTRHLDHYLSDPRTTAAIVDAIANEPGMYIEYDFAPGDIQLLSNHTVLHARTDYEDHAEPDRKRHLLRLWLSFDDDRPRPHRSQLAQGARLLGALAGGRARKQAKRGLGKLRARLPKRSK